VSDGELLKLATEFRKGLLGKRSSARMCSAVSWALQGWLAAFGVETEAVTVDLGHTEHVYLRLPDGMILDATADQFSTTEKPMPPVYLGPNIYRHVG
jgi:hypothetical protein